MSHVRKEPAKKIGRHFWSPIPLLLFPLQRKPKMTSLMFWGKFIISLFFSPVFLVIFLTFLQVIQASNVPHGIPQRKGHH